MRLRAGSRPDRRWQPADDYTPGLTRRVNRNRQRGSEIKTISILGSGWLGLPLAARFQAQGYRVHLSTTSAHRMPALASVPAIPFVVDIGDLSDTIEDFLRSRILIINITSKDIEGFRRLLAAIEASAVEKLIFVSSTSVYPAANRTVAETDGAEAPQHPLRRIETLFTQSEAFATTILRFAGLVGYERHPGRFFRAGKTLKDPQSCVNLIHRDDCINIIDKIVASDIWGDVFNACADSHPSKQAFYSAAARQFGAPPPVFEPNTEQPYKIVSNEKLKRRLNYEFVYPDLMNIEFGEGA